MDDVIRPDGEWYESEEGALQRVKEARREFAKSAAAEWAETATECYKVTNGDQWTTEEKAEFESKQRPAIVMNWVGRIVNSICGQEVANRQEPRYLPRDEHAFELSDVATSIARWVREKADEEDEDSQAFRDMVITGMGCTVRRMEYDQDPEGMIVKERLDPRRMRWSPAARRKNLADARWVQCDYWYTRQDLIDRWGKAAVDRITIAPENDFVDHDQEPHDATEDWRYLSDQSNVDRREGFFRAVHHVEWCLHPEYNVLGDDGAVQALEEDDFLQAANRARQVGMEVPQHFKRMKRVYYSVWTVGGSVMEMDRAPVQQGFQYQFLTGLRDDDKGVWYGVVQGLIDPQRVSNKLFISVHHSIGVNAKGGLVVEEDAVDNKRQFEQDWAKSESIAWVRPGAVAGGKIQPKVPPAIPPEIHRLIEFTVGAMPQIASTNPEMLGQGQEASQPGIVESMRTKAGLIALAPWFDSMRLYHKRDGRILAEFISSFISDGRRARIMGPDGPKMVPLTPDLDWMKFDIIVDESTQSRDVKDRAFMSVMQLAPMAMQMGMPVPPEVIDYAPIPRTLAQKWRQMIEQKAKEPPPKPIQIQVEELRQQGKANEKQMDVQADAERTNQEMQQAAATEAMQAESQERIANAQTMQKREEMSMTAELERFKTTLDARLTAFEVILKALFEAKANEQQMLQQRDKTIMEIQDSGRTAS